MSFSYSKTVRALAESLGIFYDETRKKGFYGVKFICLCYFCLNPFLMSPVPH